MPAVSFVQSLPHRLRSVLFLALTIIVGGAVPSALRGQAPADDQWKEYPVDKKLDTRENSKLYQQILKDQIFSGNRAFFEDYCKKFVLPRWTRRENWGKLLSFRNELRNDFRRTKTGEVHKALTELVIDYMKRMIEDREVHPFARYSAMLAVGELNIEDPFTVSNAKPLSEVLPYLLAEAGDSKQHNGVRVAAMVGLGRHLSFPMPDANKQKVQDLLLKLAVPGTSSSAKNPTQEWMQGQAVEMLGQLGILGAGNRAVQALSEVAGNAKLPFSLRAAAVRSLGQLNYPSGGAAGLNGEAIAAVVARTLADGCGAELKKTQEEDELFRRQLKTRLEAAIKGIQGTSDPRQPGIKSLAGNPASKARFDKLMKSFRAMQKDLDDQNLSRRDLAGKIRTYRQEFEDWAANAPEAKS
jgi:hypothetical protein